MPFAVSICFLSLVQAALIALPRSYPTSILGRFQSRWWALLPPASIAVVIAIIAVDAQSADALSYLALLGVPPLAAYALARLVPSAKPVFAIGVIPLFVAAWVLSGVGGELAALVLSALACVTLGTLLASHVPHGWLKVGLYAMAVVDICLVAADLLQGPNAVLSVAAPTGGLPRLQAVHFGSAAMGFGDLFIAATVGALLAGRPRSQRAAALIAAVFALSFDLLFLVIDELPTTVPIALALAAVELHDRHRARPPAPVARPLSEASPDLVSGGG